LRTIKSVVELEINVPQDKLAELYADPDNNKKWMDDLDLYEPISGEPGMVGSKYRFGQNGNRKMVFVATVTARNLPDEVKLTLDAPNVQVSVTVKFYALTPEMTKFISEEVFLLEGIINEMVEKGIKDTHRRHMVAFKHFAESY